MAYTNAWNTTSPIDPSAANLLGADIRQLRLDLQERENTILGANGLMTSDPVIPAGYDLTAQYLASQPANATAKVLPVDADISLLGDSAAAFAVKKATRLQYLTNAQHKGPQYTVINTGAVAGAVNIDCTAATLYLYTITAATTFTFTNVPGALLGTGIIVALTNGGAFATSFATVKWPNGVAPTFAVAGTDILAFLPYASIIRGAMWAPSSA